jgi:hypothetical protein
MRVSAHCAMPCLIMMGIRPSAISPAMPALLRHAQSSSLHRAPPVRSSDTTPSVTDTTPPALPSWVGLLNGSLEVSALSTLLAYLLVDVFATCTILAVLVGFRIPVAADFAVALALSKAVRGPRLALDVSCAALLTRRLPALKAVKITRCFDELAASFAVLRRSFEDGLEQGREQSVRGARVPAAPRSAPSRADKLSAATHAARQLMADYGLAYMVAKNAIALMSVLLVLGALRSGGAAKAATAALLRVLRVNAKAGLLAGQVALAVTLHYALFPLIVLGAAKLGPRIPRSRGATLISLAAKRDD